MKRPKDKTIYYRTKQEREDYAGIRYFMLEPNTDVVLSLVADPGEERRGRSNCIGIHLISKLTFLSNYYSHHVRETTMQEFNDTFDSLVKLLTPKRKTK